MTHRAWCFTLNNPSLNGPAYLNVCESHAHFRYVVFQLERGDNGTLHYQGYIEFTRPLRLSTLKKWEAEAHFEPRAGTQEQAITYCTKEETRVDGPWTAGEKGKGSGARTDLTNAVSVFREGGLKRLRDECPETYIRYSTGFHRLASSLLPPRLVPPEVHLFFGPPGCGKTRSFYDLYSTTGCVIPCTDGFWFDGYESQDQVLLDDFDGRASKWGLHQLLRVIDRYPLSLPIKGSFTPFSPSIIFITTNHHPRDWYDWTNRNHQFPALQRRFTHVHWWRTATGDPTILLPTDPGWGPFWIGRPESVLGTLDGHIGAVPNRGDYFDF